MKQRVLLCAVALFALAGAAQANAFDATSHGIGAAEGQADRTTVALVGQCVTYAPRDTNASRCTDYYYIEDPSRTSALRVHNPPGATDELKVNDVVSVTGAILTDQATGERYLQANSTPIGTPGVRLAPLYVSTKSMQTDALAVGLFVKVGGRVKQVATDGTWFTVSDGFPMDHVDQGVRVYVLGAQLPASIATVGQWITVTGVVSRESGESGVRSIILLFNFDILQQSGDGGVTFFAASDLHYGKSATLIVANRTTIDRMNSLPGIEYPSGVGGAVDTPSGVVMIGDLTERDAPNGWDWFTTDYGVDMEGRIRFPVYEGLGNHDGGSAGTVADGIRSRNLLRRGLANISENGIHYSWDWHNVHLIQCNMAPADRISGDQFGGLQFLEDDLAKCVGSSGRPVLIFQHLEPGNSSVKAADWDKFYDVIKDYNIIAIVHGHTHTAGLYTWRGIDVFQDGTTQFDPYPGGFLVFKIAGDQLTVAQMSYDIGRGTWSWSRFWTKSIDSVTAAVAKPDAVH